MFPVMGGGVLQVLSFPVLDVAHDHERRARDEDELQGPQTDVGDGEDVVKAHVVAARLECVADKVFGVFSPHALSCHHEHHHPEDKNHGEPDLSERGGILVDSAEEPLQSSPVHDCCLGGRGAEGGREGGTRQETS